MAPVVQVLPACVEEVDLVARDVGVIGDEGHPLQSRLRHEHPVERILVVPRELPGRDGVHDVEGSPVK